MKSTSSRRSRPLASALLLAAVAAPHATAALSLSNFQLITSSAVPINCILAYNTPLAGCSLSDFTQVLSARRLQRDDSNTCSLACQAGIALAQQTIQAVCGGSRAAGTTAGAVPSVLGVALSGDLVGLLCGGSEAGSSAATTVSTDAGTEAGTSTTGPPFVFSTLQGVLPTVGGGGTSTDGVAQAPVAGAATATAGLESQSLVQNTNTLTGVVSPTVATASSAVPVGNAAPPPTPVVTAPIPPPRASSSSTSSSTSSRTTSSSASDRNIVGGGGSPFDEAAANSGAERVRQLVDPWTRPWVMLVAGGAAAAGGVLFRW